MDILCDPIVHFCMSFNRLMGSEETAELTSSKKKVTVWESYVNMEDNIARRYVYMCVDMYAYLYWCMYVSVHSCARRVILCIHTPPREINAPIPSYSTFS